MFNMLKVKAVKGKLRIDGTFRKVRVRESCDLPVGHEAAAEEQRINIERAILDGTYRSPKGKTPGIPETVADGCKRYRKWIRMENRESPDSRRKVDIIERVFGDLPVVDVPVEDVIDRVDHEWPDATAGTVRRYLGTLNSVLGHVEVTYKVRCVRVRRPAEGPARDIHWNEDELMGFLTWLREFDPHYFPHFLTLTHTGARLNEALRIEHSWLTDTDLIISKRAKKKGKTLTRSVPLSDDMKAMLLTSPLPSQGPILRNRKGDLWVTNNSASAQLGIVLKKGIRETGVTPCRCHDLRHTFAWMSAQNGADLADLQSLMGHEDINMTTIYRGFVKSRAVSAIAGFPKLTTLSFGIDKHLARK